MCDPSSCHKTTPPLHFALVLPPRALSVCVCAVGGLRAGGTPQGLVLHVCSHLEGRHTPPRCSFAFLQLLYPLQRSRRGTLLTSLTKKQKRKTRTGRIIAIQSCYFKMEAAHQHQMPAGMLGYFFSLTELTSKMKKKSARSSSLR